jgi:plasmid stabilization system protein ParE
MKNGYKIFWTRHAIHELTETLIYLEENWTEKELKNLAIAIEKTVTLIALNPFLFQSSRRLPHVRRVVILQFNTLYYQVNNQQIEILSFFSNRQHPRKRKLSSNVD